MKVTENNVDPSRHVITGSLLWLRQQLRERWTPEAYGTAHADLPIEHNAVRHMLKSVGVLKASLENIDVDRGHKNSETAIENALADIVICAVLASDRWPGGLVALPDMVTTRLSGMFPASSASSKDAHEADLMIEQSSSEPSKKHIFEEIVLPEVFVCVLGQDIGNDAATREEDVVQDHRSAIYAGSDYYVPSLDGLSEQDASRWMTTYTGRRVNPSTMQPKDVDMRDIAHALSNMCRFGGHCPQFYSVAEHSVYVAFCARAENREQRLAAFAHDFSEAYIVDVPRPIKKQRNMEGYREIEHRLSQVIYAHLGILDVAMSDEAQEMIHRADEEVLHAEASQFFGSESGDWQLSEAPASVWIQCLSPTYAKDFFMDRFAKINGARR